MSRLGFASVGEAFMLGSDQIKNTQEEIAKLKALISDSSIKNVVPKEYKEYQRIGPAPETQAVFTPPKTNLPGPAPPNNVPGGDDFNDLLSKLIQHPRFDDIVKNYVDFKHPEWTLKETKSAFGNIDNKLITNLIIFAIIILLLHLLING
jgi:hypothetical protein